MIEELSVSSRSQTELIDITLEVRRLVEKSGVRDGICYLFVPHTTAAVTINENADPEVKRDLLMEINKIVPFEDNYRHQEGNSAAHIKASLIGPSETLFIKGGTLLLGTWQGIYFCEFDGPRQRRIVVKVIAD